MNRNIASSTKHNQVLVFVIAVITDGALGVLLDDKAALMRAQRVVALNIESVGAVWIIASFCQLLQNTLVILIIFLLLPLFNVAQEFFF